jgi:hypothetical protein
VSFDPSRAARRALLVALGSLLAAGCGGGGKAAGGDPGGRRLHELSNDPVFAATPAAATGVDVTKTPARHRQPAFQTGGWDGPTVVVTFKSSEPPEDVYRFYAERAEAAGWKATASGSLGLTDRWAKTYPDGAPATLLLFSLTRAASAAARQYRLAGGVAAAQG